MFCFFYLWHKNANSIWLLLHVNILSSIVVLSEFKLNQAYLIDLIWLLMLSCWPDVWVLCMSNSTENWSYWSEQFQLRSSIYVSIIDRFEL
jgi:hypothetical protein